MTKNLFILKLLSYTILKKKYWVYNLTMAYVKVILININPIILEALIFSFLIFVMISLQLWIINLIDKERIFVEKKLTLSWKVYFKKLFIVNFLLVVLCINVYMILHSNLFLLNFSFFICFYLFIFIIGFSLLLYKFYNNKLKFLKILILCWILGFITRNLNILIFSLLLNPDHFILLSLKFSVLNFIFPLFIGNTIFDRIIRTCGIRCDTVEDIMNKHVLIWKDYHAMDLYLAFKKSGLLDLKIQLTPAQKTFFIGLAHTSRLEAWAIGAPTHYMVLSKFVWFNPIFDRNILPCNSIFMNRKSNLSMYRLLGREHLAPEKWIWFKSHTQADVFRIIWETIYSSKFLLEEFRNDIQPDKLVVLGVPKWDEKTIEKKEYTDTLLIYLRKDFKADSEMRYDFYNITMKNDFVYWIGKNGERSDMLFRLGREVPIDATGLEVRLDGKNYTLDYLPFKLRNLVQGQAYRYVWGDEGFKNNIWEDDGVD